MKIHFSRRSVSKIKLFPCLMGVTSLGLLMTPPVGVASPLTSKGLQSPVQLASVTLAPRLARRSPQGMNRLCQTPSSTVACSGTSAVTEFLPLSEVQQNPVVLAGAGDLKTPTPLESLPTSESPNAPSAPSEASDSGSSDPQAPESTEPIDSTSDPAPTGGVEPSPPSAPEGTPPPEAQGPAPVQPEEGKPDVQLDSPPVEQPGSNPDGNSQPPSSAGPQEPSAVKDQELRQFATTVPKLRAAVQQEQQEIAATIDQSPLGRARFNQLNQLEQSQDSQASSSVSAEEQETYKQVITKIQGIQEESKSTQEQIIQESGIEPDRFAQILTVIARNPELRNKVEQMIEN